MTNRATGTVLLLFLLASMVTAQAKMAHKYILYVASYADRGGKGIYAFGFADGHLSPLGLKGEMAIPGFLALSPNGQTLYAASEVSNFQGRHSGGLLAYRPDPSTGSLTLLNQTPSIGEGPCYLSIDQTGKFIFAANYGSGSISAFSLLPDGRLGKVSAFVQHLGASVDPERQTGPHPHFIQTTADNRFALVADLGLDQLLLYKFDASDGSLSAALPPNVKVPAGEGPRHFQFGPGQRYLYLLTEMNSSVTVFSWNSQQGTLQQKQAISALPKDFKGKSDAAEIQIDAKGKFLYVSNRGADTIAVFKINPSEGTLTMVQSVASGGKTPRYFAIDPSGKFLLAGNQNSDNIVIFRISQKTGKLLKVGEPVNVTMPVAFAFLEAR